MKKIYSIWMFIFCMVIAGCSDDNENMTSSLKVISSDAAYPSVGGSGVIKITSVLPVTVSSSEAWCQATSSENLIKITVEPNTEIMGRTAMITISSGNEKTRVPVSQSGDVFDTNMTDYDFLDGGQTIAFDIKSNWDIVVSGLDEGWLSYKLENDKIIFTASPLLAEGAFRESTVVVTSGKHVRKLIFSQANLQGEYQMLFTYRNVRYPGNCTIAKTEKLNQYKLTPEGTLVDSPFYLKYRPGELVISFGQLLEVNENGQYIYLCAFDPAGYYTFDPAVEYVASLRVMQEGKMTLTFADNGTWSGQKVGGFYYAIADKLLENGGKISGGWVASNIVLIKK